MNRDQLATAASQHLRNQRATLWADWDLSRPDRFELAAEWLTDQVASVLAVAGPLAAPTTPRHPFQSFNGTGPQMPHVDHVVLESGRTMTVTNLGSGGRTSYKVEI